MSSEEDFNSEDEIEEVIDGSEDEHVVKPTRKRKDKKKKDPNKPKRNLSAFFIYSNANRDRVKAENPRSKFGDVAKILSEEFKRLPTREALKWRKLAEEDKARYMREMKNYTPPRGGESDDEGPVRKKKRTKENKTKKNKKDPNAPKRNQSAFLLYSNATRNDVKAANPDVSFGDIAKIISAIFKQLPPKERAIWDEKAAIDKKRYLREMEAYRA